MEKVVVTSYPPKTVNESFFIGHQFSSKLLRTAHLPHRLSSLPSHPPLNSTPHSLGTSADCRHQPVPLKKTNLHKSYSTFDFCIPSSHLPLRKRAPEQRTSDKNKIFSIKIE